MLKDLLLSEKSSAFAPNEPVNSTTFVFRRWPIFVLSLISLSILIWAVFATEFFYQSQKLYDVITGEHQILAQEILLLEKSMGLKDQKISLANDEIRFHRQRIESLENELKDRERQLNEKIKQALSLTEYSQAMEGRLALLVAQHEGLRRRFLKYQAAHYQGKSDLKDAADLFIEKVSFPPMLEQIEQAASGKVIKLNAANQFAIVNLGENQGINEGEILFVQRDGVPLETRLRVERIYSKVSSCAILKGIADSVQVEDTVIRS